jgi:hypothetical protein
MVHIKTLQNETKLSLVIILIFLIIFYNKFIPETKFYKTILYYIIFIIFILNLFLLKEFPGIVLLYSSLFIFVWYEYNFIKKK